jgi:hypothetical protein
MSNKAAGDGGSRNGSRAPKRRAAQTPEVAREVDRSQRPRPPGSQMMVNAVGGAVPVTEWDRLSADSRYEVEHLLEVLKAVKQGDFTARFEYQKNGILSRVGELLNDVIGLNEHMMTELVRVAKVVGQEGKMHPSVRWGTLPCFSTACSSRSDTSRPPVLRPHTR